MSGKKNEAFENAWSLYSDKIKRKRMEKFLPGVARLFSSGNKLQAEQEFNAEMRAMIHPNEGGGSLSLIANELAWAASGKIPSTKMEDIFANDGGGNIGRKAATSTMLSRLRNLAIQYFSENPDELENAERYPGKVKQFKDEGFDDKTSAVYALPTDKFKQLAQNMDTKAGMIYSGKDNKKRSVASSFYDAGYKPEDLKDPASAKKALSKITGGNLSETLSEEKNLDNLEQYARDMGFVNSDALLDYLATSYDRSNRLREQEDDGLVTGAAKSLVIPSVNKKWDEGVPASLKDWAHDAAYAAIELTPQGKGVGLIGKTLKAAAPKVKAVKSISKVASAPATGYLARKMALPAEAAIVDAIANGDDIDVKDIGTQTIGNMLFDTSINSALRGLRYRFSGLPSTGVGSFLQSKKKVAKDLEKRAYEMALEDEYAKAAHNMMLRSNPDYRASAPIMYKRLSENKIFNNGFNLGQESFDRVFEDAWNTSKHAAATDMFRGTSSLRKALKSLDTYKETRDFKTALEAAAWEKAGLKDNNLLGKLRYDPYKFNIELENAPASKQAALMNNYKDFASLKNKKGLDWIKGQADYNMEPFLRNYLENLFSVNRIYGRGYGYIKNGAGFKKENDE